MSPTPSARTWRRRRIQAVYVVALAVTWMLFWGDFSAANLLAGLFIAILIVTVLHMPPIPYAGRIRPWGLVKLSVKFLYDLVTASVQIAWQVFQFHRQPRGVIVQLNLRSDSDLYLTITAEMVSLVPGTLAIDLQRPSSTLLVHVFGVNDDLDKHIRDIRAQEERVLAAYASDEELARSYPFANDPLSRGERT